MKKILYTFATVVTLCLMSCGEFLKTTSGDLIKPTNVNHFTELLNGEAYPQSFHKYTDWFKLMTDDVQMGPTGNYSISTQYDALEGGDGLWAYSWDVDIEEKITDQAWASAYKHILGCNTVIDALPTMEYDPKAEKDIYDLLAASAYALRAYHYFCLINWYGAPYSKENLDKPGVIIKTNPNVTLDKFQRATVGEVYDLINSDIEKALVYARTARSKSSKFLMSENSIIFLANRIALFQEKWDYVSEKGEEFMVKNPTLLNLLAQDTTKFGTTYSASKGYPFTMLKAENPEIVFTFSNFTSSSSPYDYLTESSMWGIGFMVASDLISLYDVNDLRTKAYYQQDTETTDYEIIDGVLTPVKKIEHKLNYPLKYYSFTQNKYYMMNWRNVEVLLNMAEAYTRISSGVSEDAIKWLNVLRKNRYNANFQSLTTSDFHSKEDLLNFVWEERRRELSFEETMRFWDIRRQGCKSITHHYYTDIDNYETYVLPEKSDNFTLQIPKSELEFNSNIEANPRHEIDKLK